MLLKHYDILNDAFKTEIRIKSHPDYSTLKSLSETIEEFGFKTYPTKVSSEQLQEIEGNFIAHIREGEEKVCAFISKYTSETVEYYSTTKKPIKVSTESFHQIYTGIVIQLERVSTAVDVKNSKTPEQALSILIPIALLALSVLFVLWQLSLNYGQFLNSGYQMALVITKLLGLMITGHLVYRDWFYDTSFTEGICKSGKNLDCDSVLNSRFSSVYAWLKWSDIGLVYFLASFFLLVSGNVFIPVLQGLSLFAGIYILVSLYQQAFLIKKWCVLCLGVLFILAVETSLAFIPPLQSASLQSVLNSAFYFIITIIAVLFLKQSLRNKDEIKELSIKYDKQKRDPEVFKSLWLNGQQIITPDSPYNIILGNRSRFAPRLTVFLSLTCRYCGETFDSLKPILEKHADLCIHIIPVVGNLKDLIQSNFMETLYSKYMGSGSFGALETLESWYSGEFHRNRPKNGRLSEEANTFIDTNNQNALRNQISRYPALFFQSKLKPNGYTIEEVLQFKTVLNQPILTVIPNKNEMIINT